MYPEATIHDYLLDADGSSRDITFMPVSRTRMIAFLELLRLNYRPDSLLDCEGEDILLSLTSADWPRVFPGENGFLHGCWSSPTALLPRVQTFIDWNGGGSGGHCLEVSYFPQDLDKTSFSVSAFRQLVETWRATLGASDYFVRYENAHWELYDSGGLGVIYSHLRQPLP